MKKVYKKKALWVSYDGKEFKTKKECEQYEADHPKPTPSPLSVLTRKINELDRVDSRISTHKHYRYGFFEEKAASTWFCGRNHQLALKRLTQTFSNKDLSGLDRLVEIGSAAEEVRTWRNKEKNAYDDLMRLRAERKRLRSEIADLRTSIASYESAGH